MWRNVAGSVLIVASIGLKLLIEVTVRIYQSKRDG